MTLSLKLDIEKMYRQIWLHPEDRRYQRLFWYHNNRISEFQLNTVTFGVSSAPFLAIRTIQKLADDERLHYPTGADILKRDLYVDDLLTGADSFETLLKIRDESIAILKRGGFNIRQWASNYPQALENLSQCLLDIEFLKDENSVRKTLGIAWNTHRDEFLYSVKSIEFPGTITKRYILSEIAKIFDPLGLLGPVLLYAKIIMQECWKYKIDWNESVPSALHSQWILFAEQLHLLDQLTITRYLLVERPKRIEIHGFCDASNSGYGACLYVRSMDEEERIVVRLFCTKARVAPLKQIIDARTNKITIPRLELCGALTLARLFSEVQRTLNVTPDKITFWCDSIIVLCWIKKQPNTLKTFESNRVAEIQEICKHITWRHVRSENNPADALSRGQLPREFLQNDSWFSGPSWLRNAESIWPTEIPISIKELPSLKKNICLLTKINYDDIFKRFSSYSRLIRVVAYCLRFVRTNSYNGDLSIKEINEAECRVLRLIQGSYFSYEIDCLQKGQGAKSTKLAALNPIIDENGILRVGGRLHNAGLSLNKRHPILLPPYHYITDLIIHETHIKNYHPGIQSTLYAIRHRFWLLDGKNQIRKIVRRCVRCIRYRAIPITYKMANLPKSKVNGTAPFQNTGLDFFGPMFIKERKQPNRGRIKVYGCVFICMAVKAVHIEIVSDLTTEAFLAALKRFIGRRAIPLHIYSDNGTNFVRARNQLRELYALFQSRVFQSELHDFTIGKGISWHFNPPLSPHFGGIWEAAVKSFKHHFRRVIGDRLLTFEELNTFAIEIESVLNSRPLCPLSTDPNDPLALTPAHFLVGRPINMLPENNYCTVSENRLNSWQIITKARQDFWKRWQLEYLTELQKRQKWSKDGAELKLNTVVILIDRNQPCAQWQLGRITQLHPGEDGVVRIATVKTAKSIFKRNVKLLCPLLETISE